MTAFSIPLLVKLSAISFSSYSYVHAILKKHMLLGAFFHVNNYGPASKHSLDHVMALHLMISSFTTFCNYRRGYRTYEKFLWSYSFFLVQLCIFSNVIYVSFLIYKKTICSIVGLKKPVCNRFSSFNKKRYQSDDIVEYSLHSESLSSFCINVL